MGNQKLRNAANQQLMTNQSGSQAGFPRVLGPEWISSSFEIVQHSQGNQKFMHCNNAARLIQFTSMQCCSILDLSRQRETKWERGGGREMGTSLAAAASPKKMVWPCESRKRSSNRSKTSLQGWWMEAMTVRPSLARFFNVVITKKAEALHPTRRSCGSNYEWSKL